MDYSSVGLTTLISLQVNVRAAGTTAATSYLTTTATATNTGASGGVYSFSTAVLGALPLVAVTTSTSLMVEAYGI